MSIVAGILEIISGVLSFLAVGLWAVCAAMASPSGRELVFVILLWASPIAGILAIVGGIFAFMRKTWGLALAGSIAALLPTLFLGLLSIILVSLSKREFA